MKRVVRLRGSALPFPGRHTDALAGAEKQAAETSRLEEDSAGWGPGHGEGLGTPILFLLPYCWWSGLSLFVLKRVSTQ